MSEHSEDTKIEKEDIKDTKNQKGLKANATGSDPLKTVTDFIGEAYSDYTISMVAIILIIIMAMVSSSSMSFLM